MCSFSPTRRTFGRVARECDLLGDADGVDKLAVEAVAELGDSCRDLVEQDWLVPAIPLHHVHAAHPATKVFDLGRRITTWRSRKPKSHNQRHRAGTRAAKPPPREMGHFAILNFSLPFQFWVCCGKS